MDLKKYIGSIELSATNEEEVLRFLNEKEIEIKGTILKMWEEFKGSKISIGDINAASEEKSNSSTKNMDKMDSEPEKETFLKENEVIANNALVEKTLESNTAVKTVDKSIVAFEQQLKNKSIIVPNGKVGQDYYAKLTPEDIGISEIGNYWFEDLDKIGLTYNSETNEISGIPTIAGDHKIKLKLKRNDWVEGKPFFDRIITFIINPDPKSLWKNIPTPSDIEYYKPDSDKQFIKVESSGNFLGLGKSIKKDIVAASQRGRSHAQEGKPRDDDFALHYIKEHEWYILTVADGAGGSKSSRKGSQIACTTVVEVCSEMIKSNQKGFEHSIKDFFNDSTPEKRKIVGDFLYKIIGTSVFNSVKKINDEAKLTNKQVKDFSTTLIISICKKFKFGWFVGAFWVGDGGIGIYNRETQFVKVLGETDGGEYAGQTRFVTMPEITQPNELYRRLRFDIVDDFTALILMTDGITDPKFETDANLLKIEKWNELWHDLSKEVDFSDDNEASADQLLNWLDFWSPGNHDDRTIAILF